MAGNRESGETRDMISLIDYSMLLLVEKKTDNGEDSGEHASNRDAVFFGVFDGCGGAGSQICPKYHGKTEAYIASRATAEAFHDWFDRGDIRTKWRTEDLKRTIVDYLSRWDNAVGERSMLMGGMKKKFPTTAAAGICYAGKTTVEADFFWAGDSRVYLLNDQGLAQLTEDDLGGIDAMENLTKDGVLTNMINLSRDFTIHSGHISMDRPGIIFAATDGCFGYLSTPMEFEYLLLETLLNSDCVSSDDSGVRNDYPGRDVSREGWQEKLSARIGKAAGDDYTISGYSIGYGSFERMKKALIPRANELYKLYIRGLDKKTYDEKMALWESYKGNYYRLLCRP